MEFLPVDDDWQSWGAELIARQNLLVPNPYHFKDWQEWAFSIMNALT